MGTIKAAYKQDERCFSVYIHESPSGKKYVGITGRPLKKRWGNGHHYEDCRAFKQAIEKYGWESITSHIVSVGLTKEEAERAEKYLIAKYQTTDRRYGYNILNGGDISEGISEEGRKRLSEFHKNRKRTDETRRKQRQAKINSGKARSVVCYETGEVFETATDAARSLGMSTRTLGEFINVPDRTFGGYHWVSPELLGSYSPVENKIERKKRKIEVIETGEVFNSTKEAAICFKTSTSCIVNACKGRLRSIRGYHLKYFDKTEPMAVGE